MIKSGGDPEKFQQGKPSPTDSASPPFACVAPSGHVGIVVHEAVAWHKGRPAPRDVEGGFSPTCFNHP